MIGRQSRQMAMIFVDIESLIPETHLLRKIERMVSFNFIYDLLAPYYPATGRPSVDPVSMFKMLLIGYLYGIKSERRLVEEVQLNIAYRWFCGFELDDTIPNHSTFSKTRTRKWQQSDLFQKAFYEIVKQCIDSGLIDGEAMAADGSYIPANVSRESWINVEIEVEQSMQSYLDSEDGKCHLSLFPNLLFCWNLCGFQQFFAFVNRSLIVHYRRIHRCWGHGRRKQCRPRRAAGMWHFVRQGSESAQENTLRAPSRSNRPNLS